MLKIPTVPVCLSWEVECPQYQALKGQEISAKATLHKKMGKLNMNVWSILSVNCYINVQNIKKSS